MPIVLAPAEPFAAGFGGGVAEQYNKNRQHYLQYLKLQQEERESQARQEQADAHLRETQFQFDQNLGLHNRQLDSRDALGNQRLQLTADTFNAREANKLNQEELHAELQGILANQKLTAAEEMKLNRMRNSLSAIQGQPWSPQEKLEASRELQRNMAPLMQRQQAAQQAAEKLQQVQLQKAQVQGQAQAQFQANTAQGRLHTVRLPDGSMRSYVAGPDGTPHFVEPTEQEQPKAPFPQQQDPSKSPLQQAFESTIVTDPKSGARLMFHEGKFVPLPEPKAAKEAKPLDPIAVEKHAMAIVKARNAGSLTPPSAEQFNSQLEAEKERIRKEHGAQATKPEQPTQQQAPAGGGQQQQDPEQTRQQALQQAPPFNPCAPEYAQKATPEQKAFTEKAVSLRQLLYKQDDIPMEKKREILGWMDQAQALFEKYGSVEGMPPDARQDFKTFSLLLEGTKFNKSAAQLQKEEHQSAASSAKAAVDAADKEYDAAQEAFNNYRGGDREQSDVRKRLDAARERAAAARAAYKQYAPAPARLGVFNIGVR